MKMKDEKANLRVLVLALGLTFSWIFFLGFSSAVGALDRLPNSQVQKKQDLIILRDGQKIVGRLGSVDAISLLVDGKRIERSRVDLIRLVESPSPALTGTLAKDLVIMKNGQRFLGQVERVTEKLVIQDGNERKRIKVAVIKFASDSYRADDPKGDERHDSTLPPENSNAEEAPKDDSTTGQSDPPWFDAGKNCRSEWWTQSSASGHPLVVQGQIKEGYAKCVSYLSICGDDLTKVWVINRAAGEECPWDIMSIPQRKVCCDAWWEAKRAKIPCDPVVDADCDGTPNEKDDYPLDPNRAVNPKWKTEY